MNPLLDDASVAEGILAITRRDGLRAVTARSLASELHVSLGALYNYTTSMLDAMHNADRHVNAAIRDVIDGAGDAAQSAVCAWAETEQPLLNLLTDLNRSHAPLPLEFLDLVPVTEFEIPKTAQTAEILRSFIGLWQAGSPPLDKSDVETIAELLTTSLGSYDPGADYSNVVIPIDSLRQLALDLIAVRPHERIDSDVRAASVDVLLDGEWSFRKLQNKTGFPLARLNRMSPRDDHVMTAVGDIVGGIVLKYVTDGRTAIESMRGLVSTVAANAPLLIGAQVSFLSLSLVDSMTADSGLWSTTPMDARQVMLACGLATAVLHAGYTNRETDPAAAAASVPLTIEIAERSYNRLTAS